LSVTVAVVVVAISVDVVVGTSLIAVVVVVASCIGACRWLSYINKQTEREKQTKKQRLRLKMATNYRGCHICLSVAGQ